jgi:hypothetical protein
LTSKSPENSETITAAKRIHALFLAILRRNGSMCIVFTVFYKMIFQGNPLPDYSGMVSYPSKKE